MQHSKGPFDFETLTLLRVALDEAWASLTPEQQSRTLKSEMALRLLRLAQQGERDPAKLRLAATLGIPTRQAEKRPPATSISREGGKQSG
jgi:hypothetical protein